MPDRFGTIAIPQRENQPLHLCECARCLAVGLLCSRVCALNERPMLGQTMQCNNSKELSPERPTRAAHCRAAAKCEPTAALRTGCERIADLQRVPVEQFSPFSYRAGAQRPGHRTCAGLHFRAVMVAATRFIRGVRQPLEQLQLLVFTVVAIVQCGRGRAARNWHVVAFDYLRLGQCGGSWGCPCAILAIGGIVVAVPTRRDPAVARRVHGMRATEVRGISAPRGFSPIRDACPHRAGAGDLRREPERERANKQRGCRGLFQVDRAGLGGCVPLSEIDCPVFRHCRCEIRKYLPPPLLKSNINICTRYPVRGSASGAAALGQLGWCGAVVPATAPSRRVIS